MAKDTQRVVISLNRSMYRRAKQYAKQDFGDNMSQLVRRALAEYFLNHYSIVVPDSVDWGGWRETNGEEAKTPDVDTNPEGLALETA